MCNQLVPKRALAATTAAAAHVVSKLSEQGSEIKLVVRTLVQVALHRLTQTRKKFRVLVLYEFAFNYRNEWRH